MKSTKKIKIETRRTQREDITLTLEQVHRILCDNFAKNPSVTKINWVWDHDYAPDDDDRVIVLSTETSEVSENSL